MDYTAQQYKEKHIWNRKKLLDEQKIMQRLPVLNCPLFYVSIASLFFSVSKMIEQIRIFIQWGAPISAYHIRIVVLYLGVIITSLIYLTYIMKSARAVRKFFSQLPKVSDIEEEYKLRNEVRNVFYEVYCVNKKMQDVFSDYTDTLVDAHIYAADY